MAKILVMDDDPIIVSFLSNLLRDNGYEVLTAEDGDTGLQMARRDRPDLILSDLVMPFLDGFEILREIKNDPAMKDIPVIVISMKEKERDIVRGFDLGAEDYIIKPFGAHELLARLRRALHTQATRGRKPVESGRSQVGSR